jgi:hypothetical protein
MRRSILLLFTIAVCAIAAAPVVAATRAKAPKPVLVTINVKKGRVDGGIKRPTVKKGRSVRLVIRSDAGTEVHLHGYDIEKKLTPGKPLVIQFVARIPGRFELELHHPDVLLADLTVKP